MIIACRQLFGLSPSPTSHDSIVRAHCSEWSLWKANRIMERFNPLSMFRNIKSLDSPSAPDMAHSGRHSTILPTHMNWTGWACVGVSTANMHRSDNLDCISLCESATGETFAALAGHCSRPWGPITGVGDTVPYTKITSVRKSLDRRCV